MTDLIFIQENIYHLKQEYGCRIQLGMISQSEFDPTLGRKTNQTRVINIAQAIRLPNNMTLSFLRAIGIGTDQRGMEAITGAYQLLIDKRDIPRDFVIKQVNSYGIINNRKFDIVGVSDYPYTCILTVKELEGAPTPEYNSRDEVSFTGVLTHD